jgi:hypothetical protein
LPTFVTYVGVFLLAQFIHFIVYSDLLASIFFHHIHGRIRYECWSMMLWPDIWISIVNKFRLPCCYQFAYSKKYTTYWLLSMFGCLLLHKLPVHEKQGLPINYDFRQVHIPSSLQFNSMYLSSFNYIFYCHSLVTTSYFSSTWYSVIVLFFLTV